MSGEIEAVGAAATAGLVAGAIDSHKTHGAKDDHAEAHGPCANCGKTVSGNYCAECGQPTHVHRTLAHMVEEFLHGLLHFDTRAWRTLPMLVFRPGTLTRDYIHGKRARFISPLAIYLLTVFTMFVVFSFAGGSKIGVDEEIHTEVSAAGTQAAETAAAPVVVDLPATIEQAAADAEAVADEETTVVNNYNTYAAIGKAARDGNLSIQTGWKYLDKKIQHKLENPELAVYKVQNAAYKFAFLLVPISLPFLWLMFAWKRGLTLFDHTVYILYSLSYVSLLFITMSLISMASDYLGWLIPLLILSIPVHFFFHLKGAYSLGWFSAIWRTPVLLVFSAIALTLFLVAILAMGLVG